MERDDVGVAEEYSGTQPLTDHPFDDGGRTGSAAAMQQDAFLRKVATPRRLRKESFFMNILVRHFHDKPWICSEVHRVKVHENKHNDFS